MTTDRLEGDIEAALAAELMERVCHRDQMIVWQTELLEHFLDCFRDDLTGPDVDTLHGVAERAIRDIAEKVLCQPELTSIAAALRAAEEREAKMCDDRDDYRNLLKAVLDIEYECEIIGGGPGWQDRRKKAFRAARERFEP